MVFLYPLQKYKILMKTVAELSLHRLNIMYIVYTRVQHFCCGRRRSPRTSSGYLGNYNFRQCRQVAQQIPRRRSGRIVAGRTQWETHRRAPSPVYRRSGSLCSFQGGRAGPAVRSGRRVEIFCDVLHTVSILSES